MNDGNRGLKIRNKALELGFEACGIIRVDSVQEYANKLDERMEVFPESKSIYNALGLSKLAFPQKNYDWAKSIIVCVRRYGKYKIPPTIDNYIGKYYLYDYRFQKYTQEYTDIVSFESFLTGLGLKIAKEVNGIAPFRWAALKANLGLIRRNNFFYSQNGSWVWLEAWLADLEMEYYETADFIACPDNCRKCIEACPTGALSGPYRMDPLKCIARLTYSANGLAPEFLRDKMGKWLYGCDQCQNACPMNKDKWEEITLFPKLEQISEAITLEKIVSQDEKFFAEFLLSKF
jgi:epoxyqueuosine reductase